MIDDTLDLCTAYEATMPGAREAIRKIESFGRMDALLAYGAVMLRLGDLKDDLGDDLGNMLYMMSRDRCFDTALHALQDGYRIAAEMAETRLDGDHDGQSTEPRASTIN